MGSSKLYSDVWEFSKMVLILYHGQSSVERGFSINKQLLVENQKTKSLVALRRIEDHMKYSEASPETIEISNAMIKNVKDAHNHYKIELEKQREEKLETQQLLKRKIVDDELKVVKAKQFKLINEIDVLRVDADLLALKAEKLQNFDYLTESNQKKKLAEEKQNEVKKLTKMEEKLSKRF